MLVKAWLPLSVNPDYKEVLVAIMQVEVEREAIALDKRGGATSTFL